MKNMIFKRLICCLVVCAMLVSSSACLEKVKAGNDYPDYDRDAAVKFAREAYDTNYQACTSLASCCLYKGGIPQKEKLAVTTTDSGSFGLKAKITTVGALYDFLMNNDYAEMVEPSFVSSDEIKSNSKIQPGDIIMVKGGNTYYHNAVISSVETNSNGNIIVKLCQRNVSRKDKKLTKTWASSWNSNAKAYILHIKDDSKNSSSTDSKSNKVENILKPAVGDKTLYYTDFTSKNYYYLEALDDISLRNGSSTSASKTGKKIKKGQKIAVSFVDKDSRYAWGKLSDGCFIIIADLKDEQYFKILNITKEQFPLGKYKALYDVAKKNSANINATKKGYYYPGDIIDVVEVTANGDYIWGKTTDGYWTALSEKQGELYYLYEGASDKTAVGNIIKDETSNGMYKVISDVNSNTKNVEFEKVISSAKTVIIPESFNLDGITYKVVSIEDGAFKGDTKLTSLEIKAQVDELSKSVLEACTSLKKLSLPNSLKTICENALKDCKSIEEIDLPDSVKKIKAAVFSGCNSLKKVNASKNLKDVDVDAFKDCKNAEMIVNGLTNISNDIKNRLEAAILLGKEELLKEARNNLANMNENSIKRLNSIIQSDIQSQKTFEDKMQTALDYLVEIRGKMPWTANEKGCEPDDPSNKGEFEKEHPFYYENKNPELRKLPHCTNCLTQNYVEKAWFINLSKVMFGDSPILSNMAAPPKGSVNSCSCMGGAVTLQYLAYESINGSPLHLEGSSSDVMTFNYNNVKNNCKIGDVLQLGSGHWVVLYSFDEKSITVVDVNTRANIPDGVKYNKNCYMGKHTIQYSDKSYSTMRVGRPKQYGELSQ